VLNDSAFYLTYNQTHGKKERVIDSFDNNPYPTLFGDIKDSDKFGSFQVNGH
jgi:hypothetical protein